MLNNLIKNEMVLFFEALQLLNETEMQNNWHNFLLTIPKCTETLQEEIERNNKIFNKTI